MEATIALERQRVRTIAEEYRSRGYEVIEEPSPKQLPNFLSGYQPDLLVRRGNEAVVIEVKSRSSLAKDPQVRDLARLLQAKPGWNFELVVVGEGEKLSSPEGARPLEREDILRGIEAAERILESGSPEAALLLAWSTSEATVRLLTEEENILLDRLTPVYILKQAVTDGVISRDDYNFLMSAIKYRNALAHGFKATDFDSAIVRDLINTTKRLLESTTAP
jgi:hypothetical protein